MSAPLLALVIKHMIVCHTALRSVEQVKHSVTVTTQGRVGGLQHQAATCVSGDSLGSNPPQISGGRNTQDQVQGR